MISTTSILILHCDNHKVSESHLTATVAGMTSILILHSVIIFPLNLSVLPHPIPRVTALILLYIHSITFPNNALSLCYFISNSALSMHHSHLHSLPKLCWLDTLPSLILWNNSFLFNLYHFVLLSAQSSSDLPTSALLLMGYVHLNICFQIFL